MSELLDAFISQLQNTSLLEVTAVFFGLLSVWYSLKEHIWVYPTGIISVLIYIHITYEYTLYGDMGINAYYFIMSVYGWYNWTNTKSPDRDQIPISRLNRGGWATSLMLLIGFYVLLAFVLDFFTNSDVPYWDAGTTSLALVGMWLMARKKLEHWIAWILCDLMSVPLYIYKGLPYTSFQFLIFTVLATWGLISWNSKLKKND